MTRLTGSLDVEAEHRWGPSTMEPAYVQRRVEASRFDEGLAPSPSPFGTLLVSLPLSEFQLAQVGDWAARHPHFTIQFWSRDRVVTDLEFLRSFPSVKRVDLTVHHVHDWAGLRHLRPDLTVLSISATEATLDLSGLTRFEELRGFGISAKRPDLGVLSQMQSIEALWLDGLGRTDLQVLDDLAGLRTLHLSGGGLRDPDALGDLLGTVRCCGRAPIPRLADSALRSGIGAGGVRSPGQEPRR